MAQRRKELELEELRKQGLALPQRDESGKLINPHIPSYISKQPWYLQTGDGAPSLKHQRADTHANTEIQSGINVQKHQISTHDTTTVTKYRAGACTNCGAMGHTAGTCLERPKLHTAKYSNTTYSTKDQFVKTNKLSFEAKRDRFSNFSTDDWVNDLKKKEAEDKAKLEQILKGRAEAQKAQEEAEKATKLASSESNSSSLLLDSDYDTDDEMDSVAAAITKDQPRVAQSTLTLEDRLKLNPRLQANANQLLNTGTAMSAADKSKQNRALGAEGTAVQSLRTQGDVPKYLLNLDDDTAYYDPKTHSMRDNPFQPSDPRYREYEEKYRSHLYQVDELKELERFAFEFKEITGKEINPMVNPTMVRKLKMQYDEMKHQSQLNQQEMLLSLYGDAQDDQKDDRGSNRAVKKQRTDEPTTHVSLSLADTYSTSDLFGQDLDSDPNNPNALVFLSTPTDTIKIVNEQPKVTIFTNQDNSTANHRISSIYPEDVLEGNHYAIWGSYYNIKDGKWGYKCCQSCTPHSYCIPLPTASKRK